MTKKWGHEKRGQICPLFPIGLKVSLIMPFKISFLLWIVINSMMMPDVLMVSASEKIGSFKNGKYMNKDEFWVLVESFKKTSAGDQDVFLDVAENVLEGMSDEEVTDFRLYLSAYFSAVENNIWLMLAQKVINGAVTDDTNQHFVLWLISQGKDAYFSALKDPDSLASLEEIDFGVGEFEQLMLIGGIESLQRFAPSPSRREAVDQDARFDIVYKDEILGDPVDGAVFDAYFNSIPKYLPRLVERAKKEGFNWQSR
ncbi:DUF4240 domain-containing protein [Pseudomonas sp. GV071]|uniref:DUF4240 domain-containing protein n=1 Tax=Pseudomonas sp. GV071 TaxID=2135754 RepID=UPI0011B21EA9|nr:DUF4240 domain-containing protein [Pseudomonas sp. GV071]